VILSKTLARPHIHFQRPSTSDATEPPEAHGVDRDAVKLLVARPNGVSHARFADLGDHLRPGDLLVVNNSATLPAAVDGRRAGQPIAVHFRSPSTSPRRWPRRTGWSNCARPPTRPGT
jgi:S-adenosylmethionine:tRNA ribosyltransferase-isomerase